MTGKYDRWNTYRGYLQRTYGTSVWRIGVDAGFSCPNRAADRSGGCSYCDGTGASAMYQRTTESKWYHDSPFMQDLSRRITPRSCNDLDSRIVSIRSQIERGKEFLVRRYDAKLFSLYFQAWTNTYAPLEELESLYRQALELGNWQELIVSTRPDCLDDDVVRMLASCKDRVHDVWVELGLQSGNDQTLERIGRGHDVACYMDAARRLLDAGIKVCTHVILGLPGEGPEQQLQTARVVNDSKVQAVKIHNLHIPGGTRLFDSYLQGEVACASVRRHALDTVRMLRHLDSEIVVQRLICETPAHRLAAPRGFDDKSKFLALVQELMVAKNAYQGDCR